MILNRSNILFLYLGLLVGLLGCNAVNDESRASSTKILIATAANAQFAMEAIKELFEDQQDSIDLEIIVSSTGKLTAQIMQGAPYDLLLAANMKYPEYLLEQGFAENQPRIYARGGLVCWSKRLPLDSLNWKQALKEAKNIAIANPTLAPYGEQARRCFDYYQLTDQVSSKLILGESIAQTNQYILSGACDLGITAKSVVLSPEIKGRGNWVSIPTEAYQPIEQGAVITKYGKEQHFFASKVFFEYLFSKEAQEILGNYGYLNAVQ